MALTNPLRRRLALAAGGAILLAGGAGAAYATSLGTTPAPVESGYATVVDGGTPGAATDDRDCPERSGGSGSPAPNESGGTGESTAPTQPTQPSAPSAPSAPSDGDL